MTAQILQLPNKRREFVEVDKQIDGAGQSTWCFVIVAADGRRVPIGARTDVRDAMTDVQWFRQGGVRVSLPPEFEIDVTRAVSEHFACGLIEELQIEGNLVLRPGLAALHRYHSRPPQQARRRPNSGADCTLGDRNGDGGARRRGAAPS